MGPKLSADLEREVIRLATSGTRTEAIAAWLKAEHGVDISGRAIRKRLAQTREERSDVAKVIVRETLGRDIPDDLARLERIAASAYRMAQKHRKDPKVWTMLMDQVRKITETKLHFSGADVPDDSLTTLQAAADRMRARLAREDDT